MLIQLGATATDMITGFTGVITGIVEYISGCNQALITPRVREDGSSVEPQWIDEQRLQLVTNSIITLENGNRRGFDKAPPKR